MNLTIGQALKIIREESFRAALYSICPISYTYTEHKQGEVFARVFDVAERINTAWEGPNVYSYRPRWRYSKAMGYTKGKNIYINEYRLPYMSVANMVRLLIHESAHIAGYTHGGNAIHWWNKRKKYASVPYCLGNAAKRVVQNSYSSMEEIV